MKELLQYLGIIILLIGVVILALHYFIAGSGNSYLIAGMACICAGLIAHIAINKRLK